MRLCKVSTCALYPLFQRPRERTIFEPAASFVSVVYLLTPTLAASRISGVLPGVLFVHATDRPCVCAPACDVSKEITTLSLAVTCQMLHHCYVHLSAALRGFVGGSNGGGAGNSCSLVR